MSDLGRTGVQERKARGQGLKSEVGGQILEFSSGKPAGVPGTAVMACRAFKIQVDEKNDQGGRRSAGAGKKLRADG